VVKLQLFDIKELDVSIEAWFCQIESQKRDYKRPIQLDYSSNNMAHLSSNNKIVIQIQKKQLYMHL